MEWGTEVVVLVEVSRGGRVKRRADGRVHYVSPVASPFNYGCVPDAPMADDGDAQDAVLLGPRCSAGTRVRGSLVGHVEVVDEGARDDKWVVVPVGYALTSADRAAVHAFFARYARWKTAFARLRGRPPVTVGSVVWSEHD